MINDTVLLGAGSNAGDGGASGKIPLAGIPLGYEAALLALRDRQCRWPIGNPNESDFHFCTANMIGGRRRYCEAHDWDSRRGKHGKRPVVVSFGDTARRLAREKPRKIIPVTHGEAPGGPSPVTGTRGSP